MKTLKYLSLYLLFISFYAALTLQAQESVFKKRLSKNEEIEVIRKIVDLPPLPEAERSKIIEDARKEYPSARVIFSKSGYEYVIIRREGLAHDETQFAWRTIPIPLHIADGSYPEWAESTRIYDVMLEGDNIVVVMKHYNLTSVDIWPAYKGSEPRILCQDEGGMSELSENGRTVTGKASNAKSAKITGSLKGKTLQVEVNKTDGSISRWYWDGNEKIWVLILGK